MGTIENDASCTIRKSVEDDLDDLWEEIAEDTQIQEIKCILNTIPLDKIRVTLALEGFIFMTKEEDRLRSVSVRTALEPVMFISEDVQSLQQALEVCETHGLDTCETKDALSYLVNKLIYSLEDLRETPLKS